MNEGSIGSAGTLIGAALETAGHYMQSALLDILQSGLAAQLGAFLYIFSAIIALFIIAIGGNYKFGLWFFVGPVLFWQLTMTRVPSFGARWQFGTTVHEAVSIDAATENVVDRNDPAQVSMFFSVWNNITSEVVNGMVNLLQLTEVEADVEFVKSSQRYVRLFHLKSTDPEITKFVQLITLGPDCTEYYGLQHALMDKSRADHDDIQTRITTIQGRVAVKDPSRNYTIIEEMHANEYFPPGYQLLEEYTCPQLWELSLDAYEKEAHSLLTQIAYEGPGDINGPVSHEERGEAVIQDLAAKFNVDIAACQGNPNTPACRSRRVILMTRAIGVRLFWEAMKEVRPGLSQAGVSKNYAMLDADKHMKANPADNGGKDHFDIDRDLRFLGRSYEYHGKGEYLSAMLALPYMQGMALYFLAIAYPFFALVLVVPGRHHGFFLWMGLWLWVKSWDFGFSVVMLVDKLLFHLLPSGPTIDDTVRANPAQAFQSMLEADPTYNVHMYYNLLATLIGAVPVLTGLGVKKGGGEVMDALSQGFRDFSGKIGNSMAAFFRATKSQQMKKQADLTKIAAVEDRLTTGGLFQSLIDSGDLTAAFGGAAASSMKSLYSSGQNKQFFQSFMKNLNESSSNYGKQLIRARIGKDLAMTAWQTSMTPENLERGQLAVMLKYYNHDFCEAPPAGAVVGYEQAKRNFQYRGAVVDAASKPLAAILMKTGIVPAEKVMESSYSQYMKIIGDNNKKQINGPSSQGSQSGRYQIPSYGGASGPASGSIFRLQGSGQNKRKP